MKKILLVCFFLTVLLGIGVSAALGYTTYLPMVNNQPTPTVTPTPDPDPILLPNGNFEQGHTEWTEYSNYGYELIHHQDELRVPVHDGEWAAWLGGVNNDYDKLNQQVVVPADHPYLSFWLWILSTDACTYDFAYLYAGADKIDKHDLCVDHNTDGWVQKVYNLSAYSGQTIDLILYVETNSTFLSSIYVDDFEFNTSATP